MAQTRPMNRFLQGDVGSGKTAVAAIATFASYQNGFQTILMAPTEILATQHFTTCSRLLEPHGISVGLHTRTNRIKDPQSYDMIVGTHAVLTEKLQFERVGLVVIDEQHRFGVAQRAQLRAKGASPHLLTMTATPIPRTVALTIYGELDMSVLDELPAGRKPIKTSIIPETKRPKAYEWIQQQIHDHSTQVFVIYPLIEESSSETMKSVKAATKEYEALQKQFGKIPIALLHGKLPAKEKDRIMKAFADGEYAILVSTSVVEVGIDVPNASIMIIEGAERFGLAQLHQLRGRVGRGERQSYCFLFTSADANPYNQRLRQFCTTSSGIELAEYDLQNRGSGELYGTRQSGEDMLQFAQLTDLPLIQQTRQATESFLATDQLDRYPSLRRQLEQLQMHRIAQD
jgi:ATP-dependent DNA helicase RecG